MRRNLTIYYVVGFLGTLSVVYHMDSIHGAIKSNINLKSSVKQSAQDNVLSEVLTLSGRSTNGIDIKTFGQMLERYASEEKWILLSMFDQGCKEMAFNFYEDSLQKFGITNYLFVACDMKTCSEAMAKGINCYVYSTDIDALTASVYRSKAFLRKMNIRTYLILDALSLGFNVLHTDVDVTFTKNPFDHFDYLSNTYDIAPLWDCGRYNAGFLFIRNSEESKRLYHNMKQIADTESKTDDQQALNRAIRKSHELKLRLLPEDKYLCGKAYFQHPQRDFPWDTPCSKCVAIHHNWIVSMEAKQYRMKEIHMWVNDDDHYYSDPNRKYIYFENPVKFSDTKKTKKQEVNSLINALTIGEILNRTVIYPKFHCDNEFRECTIIYHLLLRQVLSVFPHYRESTFLQHPKVSQVISESKSKVYLISSENGTIANLKGTDDVLMLVPKDPTMGATNEEIQSWFGYNKEPVLRFHSLYNAFCCYSDLKKNEEYKNKIEKAIIGSKYMQFRKSYINNKIPI